MKPAEPGGRGAGGVALVVGSAAAFGALAIFARQAYADGVDTATLLALRFTIAAVVMGAVCAAARVTWPRGRDLAVLVAMGAIGYAGQAASFFTALTLAPAGLIALLLYLHPAIVAGLAAWRLHERLPPAGLAAIVVALLGTALTVLPSLAASDATIHPAGVGFGLLAALLYAVYIVVGSGVAARVEPLAMSTVIIASAAVVYDTVAAIRGPAWPAGAHGWLAVAAIALVSTVAAITMFFTGLGRIGPTRASALSTVEPVVTIVLAAWVLGERTGPWQVAGGALILAAVIVLARTGARS